MKKMISTAIVLGLSGLLIGCPAPSKTGKSKTGGDNKTADAKTEAAKTGEDSPAKSGEGDSGGAAKAVDLSHVKKGQTYVFDMDASGTKMTMKYVVKDVTDTAVVYDMVTVVMGNENVTADQKWEIPAASGEAPAATPADAPKTSNETIEAAGQEWECMVTESSGTKTWTPMKGGMPTFPPMIKSEGPANKTILSKVEE